MASTKDSVPASVVPPTAILHSGSPNTLPTKTPNHNRTHSLGSNIAGNRITRRKSVSSTSANAAAVAQAAKEAAEASFAVPAVEVVMGKNGKVGDAITGAHGYPSPPSSLPTTGHLGNATSTGVTGSLTANITFARKNNTLTNDSAIAPGTASDVNRQPRNRRASEGQGTRADSVVTSGGVKSGRARSRSELKCEKCGKGYKHSSCLTKHLWEHTPEWAYTSKLLISKHQQVQLLEAASILVSMNPADTTPPASSSGASNNEGNSSANDSSSSDDTTPPPQFGLTSPVPTPRGIRNGSGKPGKRYSSGSYSRSQGSTASNGFLVAGSAPTGPSFPNHLVQRPPNRPRAGSSSFSAVRASVAASPSLRPTSNNAEDDALAAAVELLSCSFHTPVMGPSVSPGSVPRGGIEGIGSPPGAGGREFVGPLNNVVEMKKEEDEDDVRMVDLGGDDDEDRWNGRREDSGRGKSEEDDDGVFGRMEE